jgi:uncharacterized ferredoxin-like protein
MAIYFQNGDVSKTVVEAARHIANAARTAPKARGMDNLAIAVLDAEELPAIAQTMMRMYEEGRAADFFVRDAHNLMVSQALLLIGTKIKVLGLNCALCGFETCAKKNEYPSVPCAYNLNDLGIAMGSAACRAADMRLDSRVMYSVGAAAKEMKLLGEDVAAVFGLPLSAGSKSPYFDRKAAVK